MGILEWLIIGIIIGGIVGVGTMALLQINKEEPRTVLYKPSCNLPECQIHPSYECIDNTWCKGNPQLCQNANLKGDK